MVPSLLPLWTSDKGNGQQEGLEVQYLGICVRHNCVGHPWTWWKTYILGALKLVL